MPAFIQAMFLNPWTWIILVILVGLYLVWYSRNREFKGLGGTAALSAYTRDLTADAKAGKIDPVVGREEEIERTIHILSLVAQN